MTAPLAVWNAGPSVPQEIRTWAQAHFPRRAVDVYRAEIHMVDMPLAVLYRYAENESGRRFIDPVTGEPAVLDPVTVPLAELPPAHLLDCV